MKKLKLKEGYEVFDEPICDPDELRDVNILIETCKQQGYEIDQATVRDAWTAHSEEYCASWLNINGHGDRLVEIILHYTKVVE